MCQGALHTYFAVDDLAGLRIEGLQGATYLDKTDGKTKTDGYQLPLHIRGPNLLRLACWKDAAQDSHCGITTLMSLSGRLGSEDALAITGFTERVYSDVGRRIMLSDGNKQVVLKSNDAWPDLAVSANTTRHSQRHR
jgi:hypothetical protein